MAVETLHKQLVLNKREDWMNGFHNHIALVGDSITFDASTHTSGFICLRAIDSGESGFAWGRVSLDCKLPPDSLIRTYAYTCDAKCYNDAADLDGYLENLSAQEPNVRATLEQIYDPVGSTDDFYINQTGRYLWLMFELIASDAPPVLSGVRIHMFGDHMVDYLPAIYRDGGDFTKRFLSVFDSTFMDMEKDIYELPARFDFENTSPDLLQFLAQWVCIDAKELNKDTTIARIKTALEDYESMYTLRGVKRSVERLTGRMPLIIESADVNPNRSDCTNSSLYRKLYGENPYKFFILLEEDVFQSRNQMEAFLENMRLCTPANTEFELVLLKRCVQLDWHTYLGVNSVVSDYVPVVIDENTTIHYDTMIGGNNVERI